MSVLVDTNVLLRAAQPSSPDHDAAKAALLALRENGTELCVVPQVLYEYWVVATRPTDVNGLGMSVAEVDAWLNKLLEDIPLRRDERGIYDRWRELVKQHEVKGKNAHDARLAAAMQRHGLTQVLTFNGADFTRFTNVEAISPHRLISGTGDVSSPT